VSAAWPPCAQYYRLTALPESGFLVYVPAKN